MNTRFGFNLRNIFPRLRRKKLVQKRKTFSIAHRGGAGLAPENTLAAFENALNLGVDFIELDLRRSKDGHLIVIHDSNVERITNGKGKVCDLTLEELKSLDAGVKFSPAYQGEKIPTFEEVLELIGNKVVVVVHIKEQGIEQEVLTLLHKYKQSEAVLTSFYRGVIKNSKLLSPNFPTALLRAENLLPFDYIARAQEAYANILDLARHRLNYDIIQHCHKRGLLVWTWTVDEPKDMRDLIKMGVDAVTTNYPDRLQGILKSQ